MARRQSSLGEAGDNADGSKDEWKPKRSKGGLIQVDMPERNLRDRKPSYVVIYSLRLGKKKGDVHRTG